MKLISQLTKMNILVLTRVYPQEDDGDFNVTPTVQYFSEKWAELGHNVIVIHSNSCFPAIFYSIPQSVRLRLSSKMGFNFPTKESRRAVTVKKSNISVYRLPMTKVVPHGKFGKNTIKKQLNKIIKILDKNNFVPNLIVSHWVNPQIELLIPLGEKYGAKTSLVFHDDCSEKSIERFDLLNKAQKISAIGCRSKSYAEYVQKALHLRKLPFLCYSGIPDALATEVQRKIDTREYSDIPEFIYVGRLIKFKHVDTIIESLHQVYGDNYFKLHVVGSGAEKENLEHLVNQYNMKDRVVFHGQIPREQAFELMQRSTCFIMVSEHETFGMVYIEAMLAGCITIAALGGGVDGVIVDGENGFFSEEGNADILTDKLKYVISLPHDKKVMIRKNAIKTAINFSDTNVAQTYLSDVENWNFTKGD